MKNKFLKATVGEYAVVFDNKNEVLILRLPESKKFKEEKWMLPGGRLHIDDQPEKGLVREVLEETNLKIKVIGPVHVARSDTERIPQYRTFFLCKLIGARKVKLSREHIDFKWIKYSELDRAPFHNINSKIAIKKAKEFLKKKSPIS
jgi:8-oxo-dGTP pyrophosphatase MutT (NUDIX family)